MDLSLFLTSYFILLCFVSWSVKWLFLHLSLEEYCEYKFMSTKECSWTRGWRIYKLRMWRLWMTGWQEKLQKWWNQYLVHNSIFLQNDQNIFSNWTHKQSRQLFIYSYDNFDSLFYVEGISDNFIPQVRQLLSVKCLYH